MLIRLNLQNRLIRRAGFVIAVLMTAMLVNLILRDFATGTLADLRIGSNPDLLTTAVGYFPASGRLLARLADSEKLPVKNDPQSAERHLEQAIRLSPNNYRYRLALAEIRDLLGDSAGTEAAFEEAVRLAPNYSEVHWKFANFLVRENRIDDAVAHFRIAAVSNPNIFAAALDVVANVSNNNIFLLKEIVGDNPRGQLKLALLLANQSRIPEASDIFSEIDRNIALSASESPAFFDLLINKGFSQLAYSLWIRLRDAESKNLNPTSIWNGDFETEIDPKLMQFDWRIGKSDYARIGYDNTGGHSGKRSLLLDFLGRDTVRLDNEVNHLAALKPDTGYRLEYYVKTADFKTTEGPRVVISDKTGTLIARSEPVQAGTSDWNRILIRFTTPSRTAGDSAALIISIKRQPRSGYDEPASGRIWFDDFALSETRGK